MALRLRCAFKVWTCAGDLLLSATWTVILLQCSHQTRFTSHLFGRHASQSKGEAVAEAWLRFPTRSGPSGSLGYVSVAAITLEEVVLSARDRYTGVARWCTLWVFLTLNQQIPPFNRGTLREGILRIIAVHSVHCPGSLFPVDRGQTLRGLLHCLHSW